MVKKQRKKTGEISGRRGKMNRSTNSWQEEEQENWKERKDDREGRHGDIQTDTTAQADTRKLHNMQEDGPGLRIQTQNA